MDNIESKLVGDFVVLNIENAIVFQKYGIDFCCGGDISLLQACKNSGASIEKVLKELKTSKGEDSIQALDFDAWSLDLIIDYIVKFHHSYIRTEGPNILELIEKVCKVHGADDPHLLEVKDLFANALVELNDHLAKEENILFPITREMLNAQTNDRILPEFHCGSVGNPIRVMMMEHDNEGERFRKIAKLTNNYSAPEHACNSYKLMLTTIRQFEQNLHIHIHVENNILFPKSIKLEDELRG